jgi:hypothetical protein
MKTGRPPLYNNCMDIGCMCELYFESCDNNTIDIIKKNKDGEVESIESQPDPKAYTIGGLSLFLGYTDRHQFTYQEQTNPEFSAILRAARTRIEIDLTERGLQKGTATGMACFVLKNVAGYVDKQVIDQSIDDKRNPIDHTEDEQATLDELADRMRAARMKVAK